MTRVSFSTAFASGFKLSTFRATAAFIIASLAGSASTRAQVPVDQLAKPPSSAQAFTILSTSGTHGRAFLWTAADGSRMWRESILLRGMVWELDRRVLLGPDPMPSMIEVRGFQPQGGAAEAFHIDGKQAIWKSQIDKGESAYASPAFYVAQGDTFYPSP